jgi:hypothetical protein
MSYLTEIKGKKWIDEATKSPEIGLKEKRVRTMHGISAEKSRTVAGFEVVLRCGLRANTARRSCCNVGTS